jgi:pimeloyl-ACP methyl ester carboxylesterase
MQKKILMHKNAGLHYQVMGEGNVLVLLHGFAEDSSIWNHTAATLSHNYRLVIPDIAGTAESSILVGENIGMEDYAESIHAILINENIQQCCMIGHSMGGYITLAFAEKYPEMLHAFGLYHSSAYPDNQEKKETRKKAIEFIINKGALPFLKTSIPGLFADPVKSKKDIEELIEKAKQFTPEALVQYYHAMISRPDRTEILSSFPSPILFAMGIHDKAVPFEDSLQQSRLPSQSHIDIFQNSAHMSMLEEPEKSLLTFTHFLQSIYV